MSSPEVPPEPRAVDEPRVVDEPGVVDEPSAAELSAAKKRLTRDVVLFSAARIGLVVVLAGAVLGVSALLGAGIPLVVAFLIAVVAALPLSLLLFSGLRTRVNQGINVVDARRRAEKENLHARLAGEPDLDQR